MRFSKPTIESHSCSAHPAHSRRFRQVFATISVSRILARFNAAVVIGVLTGACYSPPAILERRFHPDRVYLRHANFEIRFEFLDSQRLLDRARWLNSGDQAVRSRVTTAAPAFPAARRAPDLTALEITVFNYGHAPASVDFSRFRIHPKRDPDVSPAQNQPRESAREAEDTRAIVPIHSTEFRRQYAGHAIGALVADDFAFVQNEVHRFSQPLPDWYAERRAALIDDTVSDAERRQRARLRDEDNDRLSRAKSGRGRLSPGGEIRGIVLFPLLEENRSYVLRYQSSGDNRDFAVPELAFAYRTQARYGGNGKAGGAFMKLLKSASETSADDSDRRRTSRARAARDAYSMHEQLRLHDRLRERQNGQDEQKRPKEREI